ncbi:MAG: T9SS type A sorting domain-containing protein [Bacteroidetes bacterium]|nr:T9SS type A sorting domain-containing protein [Bacteroidota bacterium]
MKKLFTTVKENTMLKSLFFCVMIFMAFSANSGFAQVIYLNDFGATSITTKPFTGTPGTFDANLSSSSWTTSASAFGGFAGSSGASLSLANSSGTPTFTLTFNVAAGYSLAVTNFSFWRVRSTTGAQNWSMTINGTSVGSGTIPTSGANTGSTAVSNTISGLTGTITIVYTMSGASGTGTARLDDFSLTGSVTPTAPSTQASAITFGNITTSQMDVNWTNGNGSKRVVIINTANSFTAPTDGTDPSANTVYGGSGEQVVYNNNSNTVTVTGLTASTTYWYRIYEYNGSGATTKFNTNTATNNPNSQATTSGGGATHLAITSVNGGGSPSVGTTFSVTVQSQDAGNIASNVNSTTGITLTLNSGTGSLGGTLTGSITNGSNTVVISGVTYNTAESGVSILASTNSGMSLTAGASSNFTVLSAADHLTFVSVPASANVSTNLTAFTVEARRSDNSVDLNYTGSITLSKASGPGAISGTTTKSAVSGVATYNDIQFNTAGSITMSASDGTITGTSGSVTINNVTSATDYFRSNVATGNWNVAGNWESSPDNSNWITSTLVPSSTAATIYIRNGHNISTAASLTIDEVVIQNGGTLTYNATTLTVNNGTGDDITIENGGIMVWSVGTAPTWGSSSTLRVNSGGILRVSATGLTANGAGVNISNVVYDNGSILDYTLSSNFSASGVTFFPNVDASTVPIFRLSNTLASVGGGSATVFNGTFQIAGSNTISWQGNSTKTFRNGVTTTGTGTMTLASGTGVWAISGATADLGGTGGTTLTLTNSNGITVATGTTLTVAGTTVLGTTTFTGTGTAAFSGTSGSISLNALSQVSGFANSFGGTYIFTGSSLPTTSCSNLTLSNATTMTGDVTVTGTLTLNNTLAIGGNTLSISSPLAGTLTNLSSTSSSNLVVTGNNPLIHIPSTVTALNNLTISNNQVVTADGNITISGTYDQSNGILVIGTLEIGTGTGNVGALTRSAGSVRGTIKRWFNTSTTSGSLFPLDNGSAAYVGASISFTGAPATGGSLTAVYHTSGSGTLPDQGNGNYIPATELGVNFINLAPQYWTISAGDGLAGFTYDIQLIGNSMNVSTTNYQYTGVVKRPDSGNPWGWSFANHVTTTSPSAVPTLGGTGFTSFSDFGIGGNQDNLLPVEFTAFTSAVSGRNVNLNWATITETNNSGFDVERKSTTTGWTKIGSVTGHGTTNQQTAYSYSDANVPAGKFNYRLKQIDYNGNFHYYELSNEVIIGAPTKYALSQNFPNPFNPSTSISYEIPSSNFVSLKIYDMMGREVANLVNENQEAGFYTVKFDASKLSSGIYFYKLVSDKFSATKKLMLLK